jgi:prepilin-type N-terminal cleavage/methylation domain-containing protein/prepilin-type processing-associated H-X9-DG protein
LCGFSAARFAQKPIRDRGQTMLTSEKKIDRKSGFTLVELLVVIGIIALLVSVLLPALGRARSSATRIQCASNMRQYAIADQMYLTTFRDWHMPGYWSNPSSGASDDNPYNRQWPGLEVFRKALSIPIIDKVAQPGIWCYVPVKWTCPNAQRGGGPGTATFYTDPATSITYVPMNYSVGMNVEGVDYGTALAKDANGKVICPQADPNNYNPVDSGTFHGFRRSQVKRSSEKLMFVDAMGPVVNESGSGVSPGWKGAISNYDKTGEASSPPSSQNTQRTTAWRHLGGANVCFFDGHCEWLKKDQIYSLDTNHNIVGNDRLWKVLF